MRYDFLLETYATERVKVLSVWSEFRDEDLPVRPRESDPRGRPAYDREVLITRYGGHSGTQRVWQVF